MNLKDTGAPTRRTFLASASVLVLAACSSGGNSGSGSGGDGQVTLILGNSQWLDATRGAGLWKAMQQYQAYNKKVTVKQEAIPSTEIATRLTTELGSGGGPDVFFIQDNVYQEFAKAGFLAEVPDSVIAGVKLNSTNDGSVIGGKRLGVAWQRAPFGLLYNKALLDKAGVSVPTTPDELIAAAKKVQSATGAVGFGDQTPAADVDNWTQTIDSWTYGEGGSWATASGTLTIDSAANVAGVTELAKVVKSGIMTTDTFQTMRAKFAQGQVAMMSEIGGGAIVASEAGVVDPKDIMVAPNPLPRPGFHQQLYVGVNKNSKNLQAALEFVQWLIHPQGQAALRVASGSDPLATDVPIPAAYAAKYPWANQFLKLGATSRSTLVPGHELQTTQIMQIVVNHLQDVVVSGTAPAQALQDAQSEASALS